MSYSSLGAYCFERRTSNLGQIAFRYPVPALRNVRSPIIVTHCGSKDQPLGRATDRLRYPESASSRASKQCPEVGKGEAEDQMNGDGSATKVPRAIDVEWAAGASALWGSMCGVKTKPLLASESFGRHLRHKHQPAQSGCAQYNGLRNDPSTSENSGGDCEERG